MQTVILIPAYKPNELMIKTLRELKAENFDILVVNDGSGKEFDRIFVKAGEYATVIAHDVNKGKGAALRYGLAYISENMPQYEAVITADADGQHAIDDICTIRTRLERGTDFIIGSRGFTGKIPFFSRLGNNTSRFVYTIVTGVYLRDNQMGLRGFSSKHTKWMLLPGGDKYDYEMDVLVYAARQNIEINELPAKTIYIDGNSSSHFHPAWDTLRIYKRIFSTVWPSVVSIILGLFLMIVHSVCSGWEDWLPALGITCAASLIVGTILHLLFSFRGVEQKSIPKACLSTVLRYVFYAGIMALLHLVSFPSVGWAYIFALILALPTEYFLRKLIKTGRL